MAVTPTEIWVERETWEKMKKESVSPKHARCEGDGSVTWDSDAALRAALLVIYPDGVKVLEPKEAPDADAS